MFVSGHLKQHVYLHILVLLQQRWRQLLNLSLQLPHPECEGRLLSAQLRDEGLFGVKLCGKLLYQPEHRQRHGQSVTLNGLSLVLVWDLYLFFFGTCLCWCWTGTGGSEASRPLGCPPWQCRGRWERRGSVIRPARPSARPRCVRAGPPGKHTKS